MVQRPETTTIGSPAGHARALVVEDLSFAQTEQVLEIDVDPQAHLMSDDWTAFKTVGQGFAVFRLFGCAIGLVRGLCS